MAGEDAEVLPGKAGGGVVYEYRVIEAPRASIKHIEQRLNDAGLEGWSVIDTWEYGMMRYFLMERIES